MYIQMLTYLFQYGLNNKYLWWCVWIMANALYMSTIINKITIRGQESLNLVFEIFNV